ncbi:hypothetical protein NCCP2222_19760 [Sporosarcina sp. NCCP-2222]|nr:hypothetical protein NCCP2222_19760 [Sporosarcina sp. NCCP-2222]
MNPVIGQASLVIRDLGSNEPQSCFRKYGADDLVDGFYHPRVLTSYPGYSNNKTI